MRTWAFGALLGALVLAVPGLAEARDGPGGGHGRGQYKGRGGDYGHRGGPGYYGGPRDYRGHGYKHHGHHKGHGHYSKGPRYSFWFWPGYWPGAWGYPAYVYPYAYSYPYPYPYAYPYPYSYYAYEGSAIVQEPSVYVERPPATAPPPEGAFWHWCESLGGYYPEVESCPEGWVKVPPREE